MKPVLAWAVVDKTGKLVVEYPVFGTIYVVGPQEDGIGATKDERIVRVEIREFTPPKKAKRKRKE